MSARAQQYADDLYSYSLYDLQERVFEAGELANSPSAMTTVTSRNAFLLRYWIYEGDKQQVTRTWYDAPASVTSEGYFANGQNHLRNRVAASAYFVEHQPTLTVDDAHNATFYSYDIHGNVDYYAVRIAKMGPVESQRIKTMRYRYDLLSGNVLLVEYQPTQAIDHFEQRYHYDHNNRLVLAQSSRNGMLWDNEAQYYYYTHGPLARTVLGHEQVQGMDYAYTINGWLAGMNSYTLNFADMGQDGHGSTAHEEIASDAYSFAIQYFDNAYEGIGATNYLTLHSFLSSTRYQALYNGNISAMTSSLIDEDEADAGAGLRLYRYDQLNRITKAYWEDVPNTYNYGDMSNNTHTTNKAYSSYSYDANGNLLTLQRYTLHSSPVKFDDFEYVNYTGTNRLRRVEDSGTDQSNDLPSGQTGNNYTYDQDGNLIADTQEGHSISWNVQGKVHTVDQSTGPDLQFEYGPTGHRIEKRIKNGTLETRWDRYYYLRDPLGNVMAVYSYKYEDLGGDHYRRSLTLDEQHIYGSSRHAVSKPAALVYGQEIELTPGDFDGEGHLVGGYSVVSTTDNTGSPYQYTITRGKKYYEISNHLGNVMSTLRDRKLPQESSGDIINFKPDVSTWQDYLPFGMMMYHRNGDDGEVGRYGFQAQERDDELKGAGNSIDYKFRMHDPRLGRFFAVDPLKSEYPMLSTYQFASNNPILLIELEGLEGVQYLETMNMKDGTTVTKRIVELDIYVATSGSIESIHYKNSDLPKIESNLLSEYNLGFTDENGIGVEFRFNLEEFDATKTSPEVKASQIRRNPDNLIIAIDGRSAQRGIVMQQSKIRRLGQTVGNLVTIDNRNTDQSHTQAHEVGHVFLNYDLKNNPVNRDDHQKTGGIFKYEVKDERGNVISPKEKLSQDNVNLILKAIPEIEGRTIEE